MQSVTRPRVRPSRRIEWISLVVSTAPVAPIGWPWAMAPPSMLTMSSGSPSSRATTMAMAAKASLISTRSMEPISQSARCKACLTGHGSQSEHTRFNRSDAVRDQACCPSQTAFVSPRAVGEHHGRGGIVQSGGVAGGDRAVWTECRLEPRQCFQRRIGPVVLVLVELRWPLFAGYFHRHDLRFEMAVGLRGGEPLL